ncbi:MAG: hypothetical protein AAF644_05385, partial [Pseudomonadota bacterium]
MSAVQQLLRLKNLRAFWLTLSLFCVVLLSNMFNLFQASNAFFYQNLESLSHTQQTNVVLITSDRLTDNHQQLVEKLVEYQPRAIVVLANETLVAPKLDNVYYPYAEGEYCVPQIDNWATYQMRIPQSNELECKSIWQQIFNYDAEHVQLIDFDLAVTALPKFSAERVLNVDVMSEQLENKIIIIGQKA